MRENTALFAPSVSLDGLLLAGEHNPSFCQQTLTQECAEKAMHSVVLGETLTAPKG